MAPLEKRDEADAAKRMFAEDQSDHLCTLNAFNGWMAGTYTRPIFSLT